jgi:hypothetical protein
MSTNNAPNWISLALIAVEGTNDLCLVCIDLSLRSMFEVTDDCLLPNGYKPAAES